MQGSGHHVDGVIKASILQWVGLLPEVILISQSQLPHLARAPDENNTRLRGGFGDGVELYAGGFLHRRLGLADLAVLCDELGCLRASFSERRHAFNYY